MKFKKLSALNQFLVDSSICFVSPSKYTLYAAFYVIGEFDKYISHLRLLSVLHS